MATLSQSQLVMYAQSAGLSADRAKVAAAVAMAESGGRTDAHNAVPPDDSYGPWQINMLGSLGPARRAKLGISSNTALFDPATNARAMAMISNGGASFSPWSTYTSGAYKKHLDGVADTTADATGFAPVDPFGLLGGDGLSLTDPLKGLTAMAELSLGAAAWLANAHNWVRIVEVAIGSVLVGVGMAVMTRGAWQPVADAAKKVAAATPTGRVAKVAAVVPSPKAAA